MGSIWPGDGGSYYWDAGLFSSWNASLSYAFRHWGDAERRPRAPRLGAAVVLKRRRRALRFGTAMMLRCGPRVLRLGTAVIFESELRTPRLGTAVVLNREPQTLYFFHWRDIRRVPRASRLRSSVSKHWSGAETRASSPASWRDAGAQASSPASWHLPRVWSMNSACLQCFRQSTVMWFYFQVGGVGHDLDHEYQLTCARCLIDKLCVFVLSHNNFCVHSSVLWVILWKLR